MAKLNKKQTRSLSVNKQLVIFLVVVTALVVAMAQYHVSTPSPFDGEAFFGSKDQPRDQPRDQPKAQGSDKTSSK